MSEFNLQRPDQSQNPAAIFSFLNDLSAQINFLSEKPSKLASQYADSCLPGLVLFTTPGGGIQETENESPSPSGPPEKVGPEKDGQTPRAKAEEPPLDRTLEARVRSVDKVILLKELSPAERLRVEQTIKLQRFLREFKDVLPFESDEERVAFHRALDKEIGRASKDGGPDAFAVLPEFGEASKTGFKKLEYCLRHIILPAQIDTLGELQLPLTPNCPLKPVSLTGGVVLSDDAFRDLVRTGQTTLGIDPTKLEDVDQLDASKSWILDTSGRIKTEVTARLHALYVSELEQDIAKGTYPETWRYGSSDKAAWGLAVNNAKGLYAETTRIAKRIDALRKIDANFRPETLFKDLTDAGVKINRSRSTGEIVSLDFRGLMLQDLAIQSEVNMRIVVKLADWCEKCGPIADRRPGDLKDEHILGFGERDEPNSFIKKNKDSAIRPEIRNNVTDPKEIEQLKKDGWEPYNLVRFRTTISRASGDKIRHSATLTYIDVPIYGYLNQIGTDRYVTPPYTADLKPDAWVPVYDGDFKLKMVQASELKSWVTKRELAYYGGKTITATMDGALIIGSGFAAAGVRKGIQMGVEHVGRRGVHAVAEAAKTAGREVPVMPAKFSANTLVYEGIKAGTGAIVGGLRLLTESSYARERPVLKTTGEVLHYVMLGHSVMSVASMAKVQNLLPSLLKKASPEIGAALGKRAETIKEFIEASHYVSKGSALEIGRAFKFGQDATRIALKTSEFGFLTMVALDTGRVIENFNNSANRNEGMRQLEFLKGKKLEDPTAVEPLSRLCIRPEVAAERALTAYRESLGPLPREQEREIEQIHRNTVLLFRPEWNPEGRETAKRAYIQELMKYLCYGKDYFLASRRENKSEANLAREALEDNEFCSPELRRFAALAILALSRREDGLLPKVVGERQLVDGNTKYKQQLSSRDLAKIVHADLNSVRGVERMKKAEALNDFGLCTTEHLIDLKLRLVEGLTPATNAERFRALTDVARLVSRQTIEEEVRKLQLTKEELIAISGASFGLTSGDNKQRLLSAAKACKEPDLQAGIISAWSMLNRTKLDGTDFVRMAEFSMKGLSPTFRRDYLAQLKQDLDTSPSDEIGWERRLNSAITILQFKESGEIHDKVTSSILECVRQQKSPMVAVNALRYLNSEEGRSNLAKLESADARAIMFEAEGGLFREAVKLVGRLRDDKNLAPLDRAIAASARIDAIDLATSMAVNRFGRDEEKRDLCTELLPFLGRANEGVLDVRITALQNLVKLRQSDDLTIASIRRLANIDTEPDGRMRVEAVKALTVLLIDNRTAILASLLEKETDRAVIDVLLPFYEAKGIISDQDSEAFRQAAQDLQGERRRADPEDVKTKDWLRAQKINVIHRGSSRQDIWNYFDARDFALETIQKGGTNFRVIRDYRDEVILKQRKNGEPPKVHELQDDLACEVQAQTFAYRTYLRSVDRLHQIALDGGEHSAKAMTALALLLRDGTQMGDPFYKHRKTAYSDALAVAINSGQQPADKTTCYSRAASNDNNTVFVPYSEWQRNYRARMVPARSLQGEVPFKFESDPWSMAEPEIARKLISLAVMGRNNAHLSLLGDQLLKVLGHQSDASDQSRLIVLDGIDALLRKPELSVSEKQRLLKGLRESIGILKVDGGSGRSESIIKTIGLLDKHVETYGGFEKYSKSMSLVAVALQSRVIDNAGSPLDCRLRAQELLARRWGGVRFEYDRMPPVSSSMAERDRKLPRAPEILEKRALAGENGRDQLVHDAVQGILSSVKGRNLLVEEDDPRTAKVQRLTDPKYHDRVRMAACFALALSPDRPLIEDASRVALDLVVESSNPAIRYDAARVLKFVPVEQSPEYALIQMRQKIVECIAGNANSDEWQKKEPAEFVSAVRQYLAGRLEKPETMVKAVEVLKLLHHYGEVLVAAGEVEYRSKGGDLSAAKNFLRSGLAALGVDDAAQEVLRKSALNREYDFVRPSSQIKELTTRLLKEHEYTGSLPALMLALDSQSRTSARLAERGQVSANALTTLGSALLLDTLTRAYFPEGTVSRAENLAHVAFAFRLVAELPKLHLEARAGYFNRSHRFYEEARAEFLKAESKSIAYKLSYARFNVQENQFKLRMTPNPSAHDMERLRSIHGEFSQILSQYPRKDDFNFQRDSFRRDWLGIHCAEPGQRPAAQGSAKSGLENATQTAIAKSGRTSVDYKSILFLAGRYFKEQKQVDDGVEFFARELRYANNPQEKFEVLKYSKLFAAEDAEILERIEKRAKAR